ncbi:unnamed protein product [Effrenium voratum]|nr:unnamed protein product [Effrenium voratum]
MHGMRALRRWTPAGLQLRRALERPGRFLAVSMEEARRREKLVHESAKARGARSVSSHVVDTGFSVVFGLCIACWYFDWFSARETTHLERFTAWLRARQVAVVAFELDHVMCCRPRGDRGISLFELEEYCAGISPDFAEAAAALARRGFFLALVVRGCTPPAAPARSWWRKEEKQPEFVDGPELARKLVARMCPEALGSIKVITSTAAPESSVEDCIQEITSVHRVPARRVVLFTASKDTEQDGQDNTWTGIHVPNPKEGFRYEDLQLPAAADEEGWFELPMTLLKQVRSSIGL